MTVDSWFLILTSTISCVSIKTPQKTFLFSIWEVVINSFIINKNISLIGYFLVPKSNFK